MEIQLVTPSPGGVYSGNRVTADRWARILQDLGHEVRIEEEEDEEDCHLLIALHARRSAPSVRRFHRRHPDRPLVVALTGTDLYRDLERSQAARRSVELATRLVVLQHKALEKLPERYHGKTRVIYQSAAPVSSRPSPPDHAFQVAVIGHLRPEKDPFRTALAARRLPASSRLQVVHVGRALSAAAERRARAENGRTSHYRWLGERPHEETRLLLAASHLVAITSKMEGSSNVLSEALATGVPVVASRIAGLMGTLGEDYPGFFEVGDTDGLAQLLHRAETDPHFYAALKAHCARVAPLVDPARERAAWKELLAELRPNGG